jgi:hypothetical protein
MMGAAQRSLSLHQLANSYQSSWRLKVAQDASPGVIGGPVKQSL